jgi:hypothetical protein
MIRSAAGRAYRVGRDLAYTKVLPRLVDTRFELDGRKYNYVWHPIEATWRSERAVELPIGLAELATADPSRTLEVGNVLRKYTRPSSTHAVVDKYERAPGVSNEDALSYSGGPYDLIVSISTLEHIGYDEKPREPDKATRAVQNLLRLLTPNGRMLATVPIGHNRDFDDALRDGSLGAQVTYLRRASSLRWEQTDAPEANAMYGWPWPGANVLAIARWTDARDQAAGPRSTISV